MKEATKLCVFIVLSFASACAPAAPTPTRTPGPTPTPVEVRATKPEHLAGIWMYPEGRSATDGGPYYRWDADGTVWWADDKGMTTNLMSAKFWFEDGLYHEDESPICDGLGIYEIDLEIQGGRAVRLRLNVIEDGPRYGAVCMRAGRYQQWGKTGFIRVD